MDGFVTTPCGVLDDLVARGDLVLVERAGVDLADRRLPGVGVGAEQRGRREHGRRDGDALGDGLGRVADRVELGEDLRGLRVDVTGHLGDALGVVRDRAERVHGDDDADGREQATAGERDEEQRQGHRATTEQEGEVDGATDDRGGVDGRLEADADAREDDRGRTGERRARDVLGRALVGAGEVAGEPEDDRREDDADDHREDRA